MSRRKSVSESDPCGDCTDDYNAHQWGFKGEIQPCLAPRCGCPNFVPCGAATDPDAEHDREMAL